MAPDGYTLAGLERSEEKKMLYETEMAKYMEADHAEEVTAADEAAAEIFYIPHSGVFTRKADGSTKCRIVFDASAHDRNGNSVNKVLATGPVPNADILRIITRWRQHRAAFNTDIRQCFLNIKIHPDQRNLFRFLWRKPGEKKTRTYKFCSLIFGSTSSPWVSSTCIWKNLEAYEETEPDLVAAIKRAIWVDDILLSVESTEEARRMIKKMTEIFARASFELGKYVASDEAVLRDLSEGQRLHPEGGGARPDVKALGVFWSAEDEVFVGSDLEDVFEKSKGVETKRSVARAVASVYDPIQILLPWKVGGTLLLKEIWAFHQGEAVKRGIPKSAKKLWDEILPPEMQQKIAEWKEGYKLADKIRVPRCLKDKSREVLEQQLWGFSDASPQAFGAVVYLKTMYKRGPPTSIFVTARGKVNPPEEHSLPRCELLGAKFLARLITNVKEYLDLEKAVTFLFTDSAIVLHWIKSEDAERWKVFVRNQVTTIHNLTQREDWRHVPGEINPADLLTRPHKLQELVEAKEWLEGPPFILTGRIPEQPAVFEAPEDMDNEAKKMPEQVLHVALPAISVTRESCFRDLIERHSSIVGAARVIAIVKRAAKKFKLQREVALKRKAQKEGEEQENEDTLKRERLRRRVKKKKPSGFP